MKKRNRGECFVNVAVVSSLANAPVSKITSWPSSSPNSAQRKHLVELQGYYPNAGLLQSDSPSGRIAWIFALKVNFEPSFKLKLRCRGTKMRARTLGAPLRGVMVSLSNRQSGQRIKELSKKTDSFTVALG